MAIAKISTSTDFRGSLWYAIYSRAHNGHVQRAVVVGTVNMLDMKTMSYYRQMKQVFSKASDRVEIQVRRVIQSFSLRELDPKDPENWYLANKIGRQTATELYPGHQAVVSTQIDGESGLVHNHIIVNNVNSDTLKAVRGYETSVAYLRKKSDEVCKRIFAENGIVFDYGEKRKVAKTQAETMLQKQGKYSFKDDIRSRIDAAKAASGSAEEFQEQLLRFGVGVARSGKDFTYVLENTEEYQKQMGETPSEKIVRVRGKKLGADYTKDAVQEYFQQKNIEAITVSNIQEKTKKRKRRLEKSQQDLLQNVEVTENSSTGSVAKSESDDGYQSFWTRREAIDYFSELYSKEEAERMADRYFKDHKELVEEPAPIFDEQKSIPYMDYSNGSLQEQEARVFSIAHSDDEVNDEYEFGLS